LIPTTNYWFYARLTTREDGLRWMTADFVCVANANSAAGRSTSWAARAGAVDCLCFVQPRVATPLAKTGSAPARARNRSLATTNVSCNPCASANLWRQKSIHRDLGWIQARCSSELRAYFVLCAPHHALSIRD